MIEQYKGTAVDLNQIYRIDKSERTIANAGSLVLNFINGHFTKWEAVAPEDFQELERIYYVFLHRDDKVDK